MNDVHLASFKEHLLLKQKFSCWNSDGSMCWVNQVINTLTVLCCQNLITAPVRGHAHIISDKGQFMERITSFFFLKETSRSEKKYPSQKKWDPFKVEVTYCKTSVRSLIACTATSYSLSRVIDTMRSCKWDLTRYLSLGDLQSISCHIMQRYNDVNSLSLLCY